jgi:hypothetical protein
MKGKNSLAGDNFLTAIPTIPISSHNFNCDEKKNKLARSLKLQKQVRGEEKTTTRLRIEGLRDIDTHFIEKNRRVSECATKC